MKSLKTLDLRANCPNITQKGVNPVQQELPKCWIRYDANCNNYMGWPGAVGYAFKLPVFITGPSPMTVRTNPNSPPIVMPVGPPPKVTPNIRVPTAGSGTAPPKP